MGSFSTPTVEKGRGAPLAEQEGWANWKQLGSFPSSAVARERSASAVAEQEGWAQWRQLGSFESLLLGVGVLALGKIRVWVVSFFGYADIMRVTRFTGSTRTIADESGLGLARTIPPQSPTEDHSQ